MRDLLKKYPVRNGGRINWDNIGYLIAMLHLEKLSSKKICEKFKISTSPGNQQKVTKIKKDVKGNVKEDLKKIIVSKIHDEEDNKDKAKGKGIVLTEDEKLVTQSEMDWLQITQEMDNAEKVIAIRISRWLKSSLIISPKDLNILLGMVRLIQGKPTTIKENNIKDHAKALKLRMEQTKIGQNNKNN